MFENYAEKLRKAVNHTSTTTTQIDSAFAAKLNGGKKVQMRSENVSVVSQDD